MKSMDLLLKEAEGKWRQEVKRDFPLRADTPVIRTQEPNGRDWTFSTDLHKIFATISNDEALQKKFTEIVSSYWNGNPEELARETMHYLLYHELYHPISAPFSVEGEDNDNKKIHQAMRRGILQAEPDLKPLEQVVKVQASQNGITDFILDNHFALDNKAKRYVREDIIPVWDLLELQAVPSKTNFYTITRLLYGLMYGPSSTHAFFEEKAGKEGSTLAQKALSALIEKPVELPLRRQGLVGKMKSLMSGSDGEISGGLQPHLRAVRTIFEGEDRYKGIERFMKVLGPYVDKNMPEGRPIQGNGAGSPQTILQDLLDDMNPEEQQQFVDGLNEEGQRSLEAAAKPLMSASSTPSPPSLDEMKNLDVLALHEFYKRNHPHVRIRGSGRVGESFVIGTRDYWHLKNSKVLTQEQLSKVNMRALGAIQTKTRLPWLIDLENGTYRLNEYELRQRDIKDIVYKDVTIDVPDAVDFYLDSSGSMFGGIPGNFKVNDGSRWDMLSHVLYGFVDALHQAGHIVKKQSNIRIHNFANGQVSSESLPVDQFWQGDTPSLRALFKPNNGYDVENMDISRYNDRLKRAYITVTDGELVIPNRTARESKKMKELAKDSNNTVILFEIGGTYSLGEAVKNDKSIHYYQVHNKEEMLRAGLEVLLSR